MFTCVSKFWPDTTTYSNLHHQATGNDGRFATDQIAKYNKNRLQDCLRGLIIYQDAFGNCTRVLRSDSDNDSIEWIIG